MRKSGLVREHLRLLGRAVWVVLGASGLFGLLGAYEAIRSGLLLHRSPWFWFFLAAMVLLTAEVVVAHRALAERDAARADADEAQGVARGLVMEYFDSRGVRRTYRASLASGVLRIWRDHLTFAQRYSATLGHDAFEGQWQVARTPGDWQDAVKVRYRRLG